jgi:hypothetical protein
LTESIPEQGESVGGYSVTILGSNITKPFDKGPIACKFGNILCKKVICLFYSFESLVNGFLLLKLFVKFLHIHQEKRQFLYHTMDWIGTLSTKNSHLVHVLQVTQQIIMTHLVNFVHQEVTNLLLDSLIVLNAMQILIPHFQEQLVVNVVKPTQQPMESSEQLHSLNVFAKKIIIEIL